MKKILIAGLLAASSSLMVTAPANAFVVDTFIKSANLVNSGDATELAFAEQYANSTLVMDAKMDVTAVNVFANPGSTTQHYLDVAPDTPGYFLLKFGVGRTGVTDNTYFFQNIGELTKLVWSDSQVNNLTADFGNFGVGRLSHYTTFDPLATSTAVPEPTSILLLAMGLAAFGIARTRRS